MTLDGMAGALLGAPALPGARCRGRHHLFDEAASGEDVGTVRRRHAQALQLCRGCPSLDPCRRWIEKLTPAKRPSGVVAGKVIKPRRRVS